MEVLKSLSSPLPIIFTEQAQSAGSTHETVAEEAEGPQRKRWCYDKPKNKLFGMFNVTISNSNI
jgi:hypothetical protein